MLAPMQPERSPGWGLFCSPRPHLASEHLSAPSKEEGRSDSSTVVQGSHGWWRPGWLCIQPGPLLTQVAACCFQGDGMLSFLTCLSRVLLAGYSRVCHSFSWKAIWELKRAGEKSGYVCSLHFPAHQPAWMKPQQWPHSHSKSSLECAPTMHGVGVTWALEGWPCCGSKITADGDYSHEIKRCLIPWCPGQNINGHVLLFSGTITFVVDSAPVSTEIEIMLK